MEGDENHHRKPFTPSEAEVCPPPVIVFGGRLCDWRGSPPLRAMEVRSTRHVVAGRRGRVRVAEVA